mgnify:CR=1 FL=1
MHIFVKTLGGQSAMISIESSDSVEDLKNKVQAKLDIATNQQELIFEGKILEDGLKLSDYNISHESTLYVSSVRYVIIKALSGKSLIVNVNHYDFVWQLKDKICEKVGIPSNKQVLIFDGKLLEDNKTLAHYQIEHESSIYLILTPAERNSMNLRVPDVEKVPIKSSRIGSGSKITKRISPLSKESAELKESSPVTNTTDMKIRADFSLDMQSVLYYGSKEKPKL